MLHYEVINPSDKVTFVCEDPIIAAVVIILLGKGQYGGDCHEDDNKCVPLFMFGGFEDWWKEHVGDTKIADYIAQNTPTISEALESCMCMGIEQRKAIAKAKEHMTEEQYRKYIAEVNNDHRSSMNDICGRAFEIAKRLKEKNPDLPHSPRQVFSS